MKRELEDMLDECSNELMDIEERINALQPLDKGRQYLSNYALIRVCGTAELVYRSIVADHFSALSDSRIDTYLDSTVRQGSNSAKYDNMRKLLQKFDTQWANNFKVAVQERADGQRLIAASNSLVTNRHTFAHGKMPTATFLDIKNYYSDVVELIRVFDSIVC